MLVLLTCTYVILTYVYMYITSFMIEKKLFSPQRRFGECTVKAQDESESSEPKHILKRKEVAEVNTCIIIIHPLK